MSGFWEQYWANVFGNSVPGMSQFDPANFFTSAIGNYEKFASGLAGIWSDSTSTSANTENLAAYFRSLSAQINQGQNVSTPPWLKHWLGFLQDGLEVPGLSRVQRWAEASFDAAEDLPTMGPNREAAAKLQNLQQVLIAQSQISMRMAEHWRQILVGAIERLVIRLEAPNAPNIESVRELFDIWIDAAEESHEQHVKSEQYAKDFGEMVNVLARRQKIEHTLIGSVARQYGLATRADIESLAQEFSKFSERLGELERVKAPRTREQAQKENVSDNPAAPGRVAKKKVAKQTAKAKKRESSRAKGGQTKSRSVGRRKTANKPRAEFAIDDLL